MSDYSQLKMQHQVMPCVFCYFRTLLLNRLSKPDSFKILDLREIFKKAFVGKDVRGDITYAHVS